MELQQSCTCQSWLTEGNPEAADLPLGAPSASLQRMLWQHPHVAAYRALEAQVPLLAGRICGIATELRLSVTADGPWGRKPMYV